MISRSRGGAGSLTIQDRGSLFTLAGGAVGTGARSGGRGDVTVTGPDFVWNNINGGIQVGGGNGIGTLSTASTTNVRRHRLARGHRSGRFCPGKLCLAHNTPF